MNKLNKPKSNPYNIKLLTLYYSKRNLMEIISVFKIIGILILVINLIINLYSMAKYLSLSERYQKEIHSSLILAPSFIWFIFVSVFGLWGLSLFYILHFTSLNPKFKT